jgi:hypothetical protein
MRNRAISIELDDIVKMLEQVDPLVVSLDRIGSCFHGKDEGPNEAAAMNRFSLEFDLAGRLSLVRKVLLESLHVQLDRETLMEIEENLEGLASWRPASPC